MMRRLLFAAILATAALAQTVPSYQQLVYPPLKQVKIPDPVTFTLQKRHESVPARRSRTAGN